MKMSALKLALARQLLILLIGVCAVQPGAVAADPVQPLALRQDHHQKIIALRSAIAQRLAVMPDVARYKWNMGLAISAPEREARVIDTATKRATAMGLDSNLARRAITAQMEASKALQSRLFAQWRIEGIERFEDVPSLSAEIRPMIDKLTVSLLETLGRAEDALSLCSMQAALLTPGEDIDPEIWRIATSGALPELSCTPDSATRE